MTSVKILGLGPPVTVDEYETLHPPDTVKSGISYESAAFVTEYVKLDVGIGGVITGLAHAREVKTVKSKNDS